MASQRLAVYDSDAVSLIAAALPINDGRAVEEFVTIEKDSDTFEEEESANYLETLERAAFINAWEIDRQIGFGTMYYAKHFGLVGGVFGERFPSTADAPLFPGFTGDEDLTLAGRAFVAPINREIKGVPQVLHLGASIRDREAGDDQPLFTYGNNARGADLHLANAMCHPRYVRRR